MNRIVCHLLWIGLALPTLLFAQSNSVTIDALVAGCGNGVIESGESCDLNNYAGQSCETLGFNSGTLSCSSICTFTTASCVVASPPGGSQSSRPIQLTTSAVVISGDTSPRSHVYILRDGVRIAEGYSDSNGSFQITFSPQFGTQYLSVLAETPNGLRSSSFSFPFYSSAEGTTKISGIFLGPSVDMSRSMVLPGERLDVFGEAKPGATIHGIIYKSGQALIAATTTIPISGTYTLYVPTANLLPGAYTFLTYLHEGVRISSPSRVLSFEVGSQSVPRYRDYDTCAFIRGDVNRDCRVNISDILLTQTWQLDRDDQSRQEQERLSGDGKINMRDFSIIFYYWTG